MELPDVIITNFKRRITGVSSTAINVSAAQRRDGRYSLELCGPQHPLKLWNVIRHGYSRPPNLPRRIWHVRRNSEMLWGLIAKHILRQPVQLVFTSAAIRPHSALPRWLISKMDAVIATSDLAASFLKTSDVIQGHGVDTDVFRPGKKSEHIKLLCIGRIREEKGTHILVDALCQALGAHPTVEVVFLGRAQAKDSAFFEAQRAKLRSAGIENQVTWAGEVSPDEVATHLAGAHILAATPLYEGYGLTAFEGLAAGCALLVSDTGAFAQAVQDGATGILVPIGDSAATAAALTQLLSDPQTLNAMMQRAQLLAKTKFSIHQEAAAISNLYMKV